MTCISHAFILVLVLVFMLGEDPFRISTKLGSQALMHLTMLWAHRRDSRTVQITRRKPWVSTQFSRLNLMFRFILPRSLLWTKSFRTSVCIRNIWKVLRSA